MKSLFWSILLLFQLVFCHLIANSFSYSCTSCCALNDILECRDAHDKLLPCFDNFLHFCEFELNIEALLVGASISNVCSSKISSSRFFNFVICVGSFIAVARVTAIVIPVSDSKLDSGLILLTSGSFLPRQDPIKIKLIKLK